jgi:hypothetical protein
VSAVRGERIVSGLEAARTRSGLVWLLSLPVTLGTALFSAIERMGSTCYVDPEVDLWLLLLSTNDGGHAWSVWPTDEKRPLGDEHAEHDRRA